MRANVRAWRSRSWPTARHPDLAWPDGLQSFQLDRGDRTVLFSLDPLVGEAYITLHAGETLHASASGAKGTLNRVKANLKDARAKLSTLTDDAHGAFSTQIHAMKSALTTLQTAVNGDPGAGVSTALDGVTQAESDLVGALAQGGCGAHEG